jgi:hypothetical protein
MLESYVECHHFPTASKESPFHGAIMTRNLFKRGIYPRRFHGPPLETCWGQFSCLSLLTVARQRASQLQWSVR